MIVGVAETVSITVALYLRKIDLPDKEA